MTGKDSLEFEQLSCMTQFSVVLTWYSRDSVVRIPTLHYSFSTSLMIASVHTTLERAAADEATLCTDS